MTTAGFFTSTYILLALILGGILGVLAFIVFPIVFFFLPHVSKKYAKPVVIGENGLIELNANQQKAFESVTLSNGVLTFKRKSGNIRGVRICLVNLDQKKSKQISAAKLKFQGDTASLSFPASHFAFQVRKINHRVLFDKRISGWGVWTHLLFALLAGVAVALPLYFYALGCQSFVYKSYDTDSVLHSASLQSYVLSLWRFVSTDCFYLSFVGIGVGVGAGLISFSLDYLF